MWTFRDTHTYNRKRRKTIPTTRVKFFRFYHFLHTFTHKHTYKVHTYIYIQLHTDTHDGGGGGESFVRNSFEYSPGILKRLWSKDKVRNRGNGPVLKI